MIYISDVELLFEQLDELIERHVSFKTLSNLWGSKEITDLDFSSDAKNVRDLLKKSLLYTKAMCIAFAELGLVIHNQSSELNNLIKYDAVNTSALAQVISSRALAEADVIKRLNREGKKLG